MSNWKEATLDKLGIWSYAKVCFKPLNDPRLFGDKYPFVENSDLAKARLYLLNTKKKFSSFGLTKSKLHGAGTLCISAAGTVGYAAILKKPSCLSKNVIFFKPFNDRVDVKFIKYCFDILRKEIDCSSQTTTRSWISSKVFEEVKFPNPPFEIQKKIGDILSAYDELIENHERQKELLEDLRTNLYKEWFINLRFPDHEKSLIKDDLPEGWKKVKLKDISTIQKGKIPAGQEKENGNYPFFTSSKDSPKRINRYSYDITAILLTSARYFLANLYRGKFEASDGCYIIISNKSLLVFFLLNTISFLLPDLHLKSSGTNYKILKKEQIEEIWISLPNVELIKQFNIFCEDIQTKIEKLDAKMRKN